MPLQTMSTNPWKLNPQGLRRKIRELFYYTLVAVLLGYGINLLPLGGEFLERCQMKG